MQRRRQYSQSASQHSQHESPESDPEGEADGVVEVGVVVPESSQPLREDGGDAHSVPIVDIELGAGLRPHPADTIRDGVSPVTFEEAVDGGVALGDADDASFPGLQAILVG